MSDFLKEVKRSRRQKISLELQIWINFIYLFIYFCILGCRSGISSTDVLYGDLQRGNKWFIGSWASETADSWKYRGTYTIYGANFWYLFVTAWMTIISIHTCREEFMLLGCEKKLLHLLSKSLVSWSLENVLSFDA